MIIRGADPGHPAVQALLLEHLASMEHTAPPESRHALDVSGLKGPDISFWSIWDGTNIAGIAALKRLSDSHAEIKSMRTATSYSRRGVATRMLRHLIREASANGCSSLSLETGSMAFFEPARCLYRSFGFVECPPFADYKPDPNSTFMTLAIDGPAPGSPFRPVPFRDAP